MHQHDVIHGNICSDKILIESDDQDQIDFKIIDFGTADFAGMDIVYDKNLHWIKAFTAPEIAN